MYQSFDAPTSPQDGPPRLAALRGQMAIAGLDGFIIPRADAHQGEYVAPCDERLAWLTGFTGSAGFCIVLAHIAGVFIDGRYRVQVKEQVADMFTPVPWPETRAPDWLREQIKGAARIGFDPWLFTKKQVDEITKGLAQSGIELVAHDNLVDRIWTDRPAPPSGKVIEHPIEFAGKTSGDKRREIAKEIAEAGARSVVLTLPDSLCWLLNIRGSDIARNPVVHGFAVLHETGKLDLFSTPEKFDGLGPDPDIALRPAQEFEAALARLEGPVQVDPGSAPARVHSILEAAGIEISEAEDPCILPKACKNEVEVEGARRAHLRDGRAMVEFLAWLDMQTPGAFTEIDVVRALEGFRARTNALREISFDTISGAGPNGAIVHYRVSHDSNRTVGSGELLLVDSGGQYVDGTTDITRTVAIGAPTQEQKECFTRVLQGMIAISQVRFPRGLAGRDLDALARAPLWRAGQDFDHGTGHGVGSYLSVHEGPQRISRNSEVALQPGMILSNEPGYYREGGFGIRIENLIVTCEAPALGDERDQLCFETLTWVPIDRALIETAMLAPWERAWIDSYHREIVARLGMEGPAADWLARATAPL